MVKLEIIGMWRGWKWMGDFEMHFMGSRSINVDKTAGGGGGMLPTACFGDASVSGYL